MNKIELYGHIKKKNLIVYGSEKLKKFFENHNGKQVIFEITVLEKGTNDHHVWYIMKMIVPAFIRGNAKLGLLITPEEAVNDIILECPSFYREDGTKHTIFDFKKWIPDCSMSTLELEFAIEYLHLYCLENFDIAIGNYKII